MLRSLALSLALTLSCVLSPQGALALDTTVNTSSDNKEMAQAIVEARATLDTILARVPVANGTYPDALTLKVAVPVNADGIENENIWVRGVQPKGGDAFTAVYANHPRDIKGAQIGDALRFDHAQIIDWAVPSDGKFYGHYTTRVLLPQLSEDDAAYMRNILHATPMP